MEDVTSQGRPLVTFALFAYNQERYIREAIEGAFSQTYEPLEIILSDDCSTDRTFEIMQEMAADYEGRHNVVVRQSPGNRGLGLHIQDVAALASGDFIVVAAGDDVSLPQRTTILVDIMKKEGSKFAASNYNRMDENGVILECNIENDYSENNIWRLIKSDPSYFANGAAAAYDIRFFRAALHSVRDTLNSGRLFNEDAMFAAYAVAVNERPSNYSSDALLNYRIVSSSLSNFSRKDSSLSEEISVIKREKFYSSSRLAMLSAIAELAINFPEINSSLNHDQILIDKRCCEIELAASSDSFFCRLKALIMARTLQEFRVIAARLFGMRFLAYMRFLRRKISDI